jgi:hypothetical protein
VKGAVSRPIVRGWSLSQSLRAVLLGYMMIDDRNACDDPLVVIATSTSSTTLPAQRLSRQRFSPLAPFARDVVARWLLRSGNGQQARDPFDPERTPLAPGPATQIRRYQGAERPGISRRPALVGFTRARDRPPRAGSACARTACAGRHRTPASGTGRRLADAQERDEFVAPTHEINWLHGEGTAVPLANEEGRCARP